MYAVSGCALSLLSRPDQVLLCCSLHPMLTRCCCCSPADATHMYAIQCIKLACITNYATAPAATAAATAAAAASTAPAAGSGPFQHQPQQRRMARYRDGAGAGSNSSSSYCSCRLLTNGCHVVPCCAGAAATVDRDPGLARLSVADGSMFWMKGSKSCSMHCRLPVQAAGREGIAA